MLKNLTLGAGRRATLVIYDENGNEMGYVRGLIERIELMSRDYDAYRNRWLSGEIMAVGPPRPDYEVDVKLSGSEFYDGAPPRSGREVPSTPPLSPERVRRIARDGEEL
jgi:hypothetical protein